MLTLTSRTTFGLGSLSLVDLEPDGAYPGWLYVNSTQARVIREEGTSVETMPPYVGHFLN